MYKGNKEREAREIENTKSEIIQKNSESSNDTIKIPKLYETSEKNNYENSGYKSD